MIEYVLSFFLALLVSALAAHPFMRSRAGNDLFTENDAESETLSLLYEKKDLCRFSLRDIELDRDMGKLDERDYVKLTEKYRKKAMEISENISELESRGTTGSPEKKSQTHSAFQTPGK